MVCCQHCYEHFLAKDVELVAFGPPQDPVLASSVHEDGGVQPGPLTR